MKTVACPFINRGMKTHEVWLHNFKNVKKCVDEFLAYNHLNIIEQVGSMVVIKR